MPSMVDHDTHSLAADLAAAGHHPVHARRMLRHFYATRGSPDWDAIPISRGARRHAEALDGRPTRIAHSHVAADGTTKLLLAMADGAAVEAVLMPAHRDGVAAACVSSQVGCAMGCDFCASTRHGLGRDLTAGEITDQFVHLAARAAAAAGRKIKTLVFMGQGEPLANLANVERAIRRIADPDLGGVGWRQVTVSTVGLVPGIDRLADADLNVNLALSLHAPDDQTRGTLVPSNRRYPVAAVMAAARRFQERTGRVPTVEYCLLAGVNDSDAQAEMLADLMVGFRGHVNLIPYNPTGPGPRGVSYDRPSPGSVARFLGRLRDRKVVAHVRETRGDDVNAACGQLRILRAV